MICFIYWKEEREEIIAKKARKGSTKAMKLLLSVIDRSVDKNDKWTKFVEILEKKGTYCIQSNLKQLYFYQTKFSTEINNYLK